MNELICTICGKPFTAKRSDRKYCSYECKLKSKRLAINKLRDQQAEESRRRSEQKNAEIRKQKERKEASRRRAEERDAYADELKYWEGVKREEFRFAKQEGKPSTLTVNGISVYDPDFEKKVIESGEVYGSYYGCFNDSFDFETGRRRKESKG